MDEPTDHDQLFKAVVREFFPDFLTLFYPDQAARFDLSAVRWLDKEVFTDPPDGPRHVLDLVVELNAVGVAGTSLALVHVEVESAESVTDIERRLPAYYFHLRRTHRKPVLPLVLFLKVGLKGLGIRVIDDPPDGDPVLSMRYRYIGLTGLPAADYLAGDSWLGVALSALMRAAKADRLAIGVEAMRRLGDAPLPDGQKALLGDCVETYIELPEAELTRFRGIIDANATGRVRPVNKTRVQLAEERGREQGREEGVLRGQRAAVGELLEARFGPVQPELLERVNATTDPDALRRLLRTAATAADLATFRDAVGL
jgi:hypothetical protein